MGKLSTKVKNVLNKELNRKPTKKDYRDVEVVRKWVDKGQVSVFYKNRLLDKVKLIDK